jgi:hypothetical protein
MIIGIIVGAILNATPGVNWQTATIIEVLVCITVFLGSGLFLTKDAAYNSKVAAFFKKLATPAPKAEATDESVVSGLMLLYAIAFLVTGVMFIAMSIPSISVSSGKLAMGSGVACLIGALIFYLKRKKYKTIVTDLTASRS